MPKITMPLIVSVVTVIALWINFSHHEEVWHDAWRSDNVTGYDFQKAPDYFRWMEERKFVVLIFQEALILTSGLLILRGLEKEEK